MMRSLGSIDIQRLQHAIPAESVINGSMAVEMAPNLTWVKGQVLGMITASKKMSTYATANVDGTGVAACIAMFGGKTDANGNVFLTNDANGDVTSFLATADPTLQVYWRGPFFVADLTGLDADAIVDFGARLIMGGAIVYIP